MIIGFGLAQLRQLQSSTPDPPPPPPFSLQQRVILTPEQELSKQFDLWNAALQTGNPETVADMYADDAVLLPTISNTPRTDRASR